MTRSRRHKTCGNVFLFNLSTILENVVFCENDDGQPTPKLPAFIFYISLLITPSLTT